MIVRNNNQDFYNEFPDAARFSDPWKSIVCIPLNQRYVMSLALQIPMEGNITHYEYFEMLGFMVRLFINLQIAEKDKEYQLMHSFEVEGKPLTNRQRIIFELMQKGIVNRKIAQEISYSESLVR